MFAEPLPEVQGEPSRWSYLPTPGLRLLGTLPQGPVRGIRQVTTGAVYAVAGDGVYRINTADWSGTVIGHITPLRPYPVSMSDNGLELVIADGTASGWKVTLADDAMLPITESAFYGADKVDFLDTYFVFNKPHTPQFYASDSLTTTFDPLWFANKEAFSDLLVTLAVAKREIWLLGERTTEVWFNSGAADFPFQRVQSVFVDHGCCAKYSVCTYDDAVFWLSADRAGQGIILQGLNYETKRISTYAIEHELTTYPRLDDAIGYVYSLAGHAFYVLTFPHADKTWVYDITTEQWHEWLWIDDNGAEHRHRTNCAYAINGMVVAGDHKTGALYAVERSKYSDNGQPIKRQRSYPHLINDANRVFYREFIADIESGNPGTDTPVVIPPKPETTLIACSFTAADGTSLDAYDNATDVRCDFGPVPSWTGGGIMAIESDQVRPPSDGTALHRSLPVGTSDYTVRWIVTPDLYTAFPAADGVSDVRVVARATNDADGYAVEVSDDSTQYTLNFTVMPSTTTSISMGTLSSGHYAFTMSLAGADITVSVQRSADELWLAPDGTWGVAEVAAIDITDTTWPGGGYVLLGGSGAA